MNATMIRVERNAQMEKAIARCRKNHPKVRRVDADTVAVTSKNDTYLVKILTPKADLVLVECSCPAKTLCYHVPAALSAPSTPVAHPLAGMLVKHMDGIFRIDNWQV